MTPALLLVLASLLLPAGVNVASEERAIVDAVSTYEHGRPRPNRAARLFVDFAIHASEYSSNLARRIGSGDLFTIPRELLDSLREHNRPVEKCCDTPTTTSYHLSRPGLSRDGLTAVVLLEYVSPTQADGGGLLYLEKMNGRWAVTARGPEWEY